MNTLPTYIQKLWNLDTEVEKEFNTVYYNYEGKPFFMFEPREGYMESIEKGLEKSHKEDGFVWRNPELVDDVFEELGISYDQVTKIVKKLFKEKYNLKVKTGIDFGGSYF